MSNLINRLIQITKKLDNACDILKSYVDSNTVIKKNINYNDSIIIENGSNMSRIGYTCDFENISIFPSIVGNLRHERPMRNFGKKKYYVGNQALAELDKVTLEYPIQQCIIKDWDNMEKIWNYGIFNQLRANPLKNPILLIDSPFYSNKDREKIVKIMFDKFNAQKLYIANDALLSLYASNRTTGIVLDIGYSVIRAIPIHNGRILHHAIKKLDFGGLDLTEQMKKKIEEKGYINKDIDIINNIKEKKCYVATNYENEIMFNELNKLNEINESNELPTGDIITLNAEYFAVPEILFKPSLIGLECQGIHEIIQESFMNCDVNIQKELFTNIVLSGGSSLFNGLENRLTIELRNLTKLDDIKVIAPSKKQTNLSWFGGYMLTFEINNENMWITREEYNNYGPSIVNRKCNDELLSSLLSDKNINKIKCSING